MTVKSLEPLASEETRPAPDRKIISALFAMYIAGLAAFCFLERRVLFAWPAGIVTGNLLASAIWAPLAVVHLDRLARRHHHAHMTLIHRHHQEHMEAIRQVSNGN
jgi:hypothetical protein